MSEVKRYWVPNGTLSDQSGWHQDDHEVVQACAYDAALARETTLREELAHLKVAAANAIIEGDALQQRLTDAEKKLGEAYEWGYSDGQNCPNGYSDEKDREKCVAELTKPAAEPEALGTWHSPGRLLLPAERSHGYLGCCDVPCSFWIAQAKAISRGGRVVMLLSGVDIKEEDLIERVVRNVKGPSKYRNKYGTPRWALVRDAFGVGSGVATALCKRYGLDPDEQLRS